MNKLTEIKDNFKTNAPWWFGVSREDMEYLFYLLEEKEKALQEIFQTEDFINGGSTADAMRRRAYSALKSSNNEGETE